jgi:hypothetical protein
VLVILSVVFFVLYKTPRVNNNEPINTEPSITIIYPNGGEEIKVGSTVNIKWETKNIPSDYKVSITIRKSSPSTTEGQEFDPILFVNLDNDGNEDWTVSDMYKEGDYLLGVTSYESLPITNPISDESDAPFKIVK